MRNSSCPSAFQLTASQGGWRYDLSRGWSTDWISTHSLTRRLTTSAVLLVTALIFQLTASQGGWRYESDGIRSGNPFQLTASQGGWLYFDRKSASWYTFQLTASQGGWREKLKVDGEYGTISTHSLTRRLTSVTLQGNVLTLFQLTASQGGWRQCNWMWYNILIFQLTASQGGWRLPINAYNLIWNISTHSLTRRLTRERITRNSRISYFNSQPHKEADVFLPDSSTTICISTHSLTRRLTEKTEVLNTIFNISTHSLTRRLTHVSDRLGDCSDISTHSLTRRLTTALTL